MLLKTFVPGQLLSLNIQFQESRKFETEFEEFQQKNAQQKEEWIKANPEKAKAMRQAEGEDWGDDWEDDSIRELKQIFQVTNLRKNTF